MIYPREAVDTLKSAPIGTGPFRFEEWVRGDKIVLVRNKDYYVPGVPKLDRVTFRFITDPNAVLAALKAGDVDASMFGLGPEHVQEVQKDARFQVIVGDTTNDVILAMNNSRKPYTDVRVRRAMTYGINKSDVLKGAMFGMGKILGSNVDPLNPYYIDVSKEMPYDPAKAKKLLAEAGYPNGFDTVLKVSPQYYYTVRSGEVIAENLKKVGVNVKIEQIEWGQWLSRVFCLAAVHRAGLRPHHHRSRRVVGHRATTPTPSTTSATTARSSRTSTSAPRSRSTTRRVATSTRRCSTCSSRMRPVVWLFMHPRLIVAKKGLTGLWKDLPVPSADLSEVGWVEVNGARARVRRYVARRVAALGRDPAVRLRAGVRGGAGPARRSRRAHHGHRGQPRGHRAPAGVDGAQPAAGRAVRRLAARRAPR